eukprot:TRINITY_DN11672_c0_g1_i1.p1 TRINITY_DN11672_c0_g1~~TRINITY_DN11672_c0_g1_i1.p1  ORF type:complete len:136 (-),score=39.48 TRINITY_DN11672_c0_g1_i1:27-434(-)
MSTSQDGDVEISEEQQHDILSLLKVVLKKSLARRGLARGLRECVKAFDRGEALMCILAEDCEEAAYKQLVEALCQENNVYLVEVPEASQLGEWAGLCKYDAAGNARKKVSCSCVVVKDYGEASDELELLFAEIKA